MSNGAPSEFFQRDRAWHPPALTPIYKTSTLRSPRNALLSLQNSLSEVTGPVFSHNELGPLDNDLILQLRQDRRADRRAHHRARPGAGRERPAGAEHAGRVLAGQCRRPLPPQERHLPRADRPQFRRLRARADRRRGLLLLPHHQAGPLSLAQLRQQLAAGAHPLLGVRLGLRAAAHHADVFRGRSADPEVPDPQHHPGSGGGQAADRAARPQRQRCRSTRSPTASTSCCAGAARRCSRTSWKGTEPWSSRCTI